MTAARPSLVRRAARRLAWSLAGLGCHRQAVAMARASDPGGEDNALQRAARDWRNAAVVRTRATPARRAWPKAVEDPFPRCVDEIPELAASDLTPARLAGALQHHGSLLVRGLLDAGTVRTLTDGIDTAFAARRAHLDRGGPESGWYAPAHAIQDPELVSAREWLSVHSLLTADAPLFLARWIGILHDRGIIDLVGAYLGETPVLSARKTTLYRVTAEAGSQWHQDGAFLGAQTRTVNLWVSLSDCGVDAPGLDIVPWRLPEVVETNTRGAYFHWSVGEDLVEDLARGRAVSRPVFRPGDAVLFDQLCLHRTAVEPDMPNARYALESWMFAPSTYADQSRLLL